MATRPRLFLVDGYALIYRAFHAAGAGRPLATSRGENTAIPWGIANFLERLRKTHAPEYLGWVHDAGLSDREVTFADYKANRVALEPEAQADFDRGVERVEQLLAAQHVPLLELAGYEADDVIATLAVQAVAAGVDAVVVSPDKDLLQLVRPGITILNPYHGRPGATTEKWYDLANAHERLGVPPEQVVDYLALVGDTADNVPGVKGIGEKGAIALLQQWGSLDAILANVDALTPPRAQKAIAAGIDAAQMSRQLVTAQYDLAVTLDLEALAVRPADHAALRALYVELEFQSLARALGDGTPGTASAAEGTASGRSAGAAAGSDSAIVPAALDPAAAALIGLPTQYTLVDTPEALEALVAKVRAVGRFAFDTETELEPGAPSIVTPLRAELVGISLALAPGEAYYLPFGHRAPGGQGALALGEVTEGTSVVRNLPPLSDPRCAGLVALLGDAALPKCAQNAKYDLLVLRKAGVTVRGIGFDTMLASYLLDPGRRSHGLDALAFELLQHTMISYESVTGKGKAQVPFAEVPMARAVEYAAEDADYTFRLWALFAPRLEAEGLAPLLRELELPLVGVLADMEWTGVAIDRAHFAALKERFAAEKAVVERRIWDEAGEEFNINSNPQLRTILFDKLGLPVKKKTATGPSTDASVLQELADEGHALPVLLMEYRELAKLEATYLDALPALVNPRTGRLHTSYSQTVAATGRLASSDPNLQNIPIRTAMGREIRRGFIPRAGWQFLAADYSQIELRLLAHLSGDPAFVAAFRAGGDIHRQTASVIFDVPLEAVTSEMRARAKTINFATIYGQGPFSLARQLKITQDEAKAFIATYFERFAGVRQYLDACVARARETGYAETMFGRRRRIPELRERNFNIRAFGERIAQNSPIQGSAADLIKRAMLDVAAALAASGLQSTMLLQVHDELVFEGPPEEMPGLSALVKDKMEGAAALSVPLLVEIGVGDTWLDAK
jgi:DNA polymerase I